MTLALRQGCVVLTCQQQTALSLVEAKSETRTRRQIPLQAELVSDQDC